MLCHHPYCESPIEIPEQLFDSYLDYEQRCHILRDFAAHVSTEIMKKNPHCEVICATVSGSHLYGTWNETSDVDVLCLVKGIKTKHHVTDQLDITLVELEHGLKMVDKGSVNIVELFYSPVLMGNTSSTWLPFVQSFHPGNKYTLIKKMFSMADNREKHRDRLYNDIYTLCPFISENLHIEYGSFYNPMNFGC